MQYVQPGVILHGQLYGGKRALVAGFHVAYQRVKGSIGGVGVFQLVGLYHVLVFAVGGYQHLGIAEDLAQGHVVVHQHIAGAGAHKDLQPGYTVLFFVGTQGFFHIVVGHTHKE